MLDLILSLHCWFVVVAKLRLYAAPLLALLVIPLHEVLLGTHLNSHLVAHLEAHLVVFVVAAAAVFTAVSLVTAVILRSFTISSC